jgi:hypothetical protein
LSGKKKTDKRLSGSAPVSGQHHEPRSEAIRIGRRQLFIIAGIVIIVILGILAVPYYQNYVAPFNRVIITVDDVQITARYFLERARIAGADPMSMLQSLTNEQVIKMAAPQYGIQVTDADIDKELRSMASGGTDNISDIEFKEWYRQQLNNSKVSDAQYREMVYLSLLTSRMQAYLAAQTPTATEQVHLHAIVLTDYNAALEAKKRLDAGEDFATVAREVSIDSSANETGGDQGWLPPVIMSNYQSLIEELEIGKASDVIPYYSQQSTSSTSSGPSAYYIFMVSEKDSNRELSDTNFKILQSMALTLWLPGEIQKHNVKYNFNSEIYAWLNWQLQKSGSSSSSTSGQTSGG